MLEVWDFGAFRTKLGFRVIGLIWPNGQKLEETKGGFGERKRFEGGFALSFFVLAVVDRQRGRWCFLRPPCPSGVVDQRRRGIL